MEALPLFLAVRGQPVLVLGGGEAAEAKRRLVREAGGVPVSAPGPAVRLAFLAPGEDAEAVAAELRAAGLLVNVVDRPDLSDFIVPAILDRAPVTVAVGTAGASASLAKALKERLELLLPAGLGKLAQAIRAARAEVAARLPAVGDRRAFWARLLAPGAPLDPLAPVADPEAAIAAALAGAVEAPGSVIEIRVPEAGAEALTLAELRALAAADLVVHGPRCPADVLALARRDAARAVGGAAPPGATGRVVVLRDS
jgi:uroporphyrin-III C-methyltransferase/precorrin-2 dehydrogenase/sirohydrochlorin ferrochelatase